MGCGSSNAGSTSGTTAQPTEETSTKQPTSESQEQTASAPPAKPKTPEKEIDTFVKDAVDHHNQLRKIHGAPPMTPADDLCRYSQNWANYLAKMDTMKHSKCTMPTGGRVGENLYMCWSSDKSAKANAKDATQSWYDEIKDYNFNDHGFAMNTGHFTQVVWQGSTELGIAWAKSEGGSIYVCANYRPAGNMMGDFDKHVLPKS